MEGRSKIQQSFVDGEVEEALIRARLAYDHAIREVLDGDAEIIGPPGEGYLRMRDGRGELVSVDERIKELKADPSFRALFPDLPKVGRDDEDGIKQNFDKIASGEVVVIK
jgi:hypothetical protein